MGTSLIVACSSSSTSGTPTDAGTGGDVVLRDAGPPPGDASIDMCKPGDVSGFMPTWKPPTAFDQGVCSDSQTSLVVDCLSGMPDAMTCKAFRMDVANKACIACALTRSTATTYGPIVEGSSTVQVNFAGCIARASGDVTATGCGAKVQGLSQCEAAACDANCAVPPGDRAAFLKLLDCRRASGTSACKTYADGATCRDALVGDGGAADKCAPPGMTFQDNAKAMVKTFCGGRIGDAGPG